MILNKEPIDVIITCGNPAGVTINCGIKDLQENNRHNNTMSIDLKGSGNPMTSVRPK